MHMINPELHFDYTCTILISGFGNLKGFCFVHRNITES